MVMSSVLVGLFSMVAAVGFAYWFLNRITLRLPEQTEAFLMRFGKFEKSVTQPGLHWLPQMILPWVQIIKVSKRVDYRTYKAIQVNDRYGTTVVVDLWLEFQITDAYRALFSVEHWEEVFQSVVIHSTASILSAKTVDEILKHRMELAEKLSESVTKETQRWGISLKGAMIQNIGLLPEISKQFLHSVAARIERTKAQLEEEGRLRVAHLEATTSRQIANLNGQARAQLPLEIGEFYKSFAADSLLHNKFQKYWELMNLDPRKTVTFSGFEHSKLDAAEVVQALDAMM